MKRSGRFILWITVGLIAILAIIALIFLLPTKESSLNLSEQALTEEEQKPQTEFGIAIDGMVVYKGEVKSGQNLSGILSGYGVGAQTIDILSRQSTEVFDVRSIRAGNPYTLICKNDEKETPAYFIYEQSRSRYVVFELIDSIHVHSGEKEVITQARTVSGVIESSLWNALAKGHGNPLLSLDLSEIFAWTIDFYAIQKGDSFKVIYDELSIDGHSVGNGQIHAARFMHSGKVFNAFRYEQDGKAEYFSESGENLRRAFLKAPLRFSRISSRFSNSRMHPVLRIRRPHHGVDYAAPTGTPVQSIGDGMVISAGYSGGAGHMIKIRHNGTYTSAYLHLSKYGKGVKTGARVSQGQVIGYVGSTGLSTGPHLDFRVWQNGKAIDPLSMESPPAEPVKSEKMEDFLEKIKLYRYALEQGV
jgi:murein DD-endopeptidase MepM/ murein hydrolase activator NlpD